ncbi:hypothetical protein D3218_12975 [Aureimonas flava]|uniref:Uncharacterized protein n=1 Tax=Aureimonas flava TaxID=2320271 RepID=A0A3A1WHX5_9HYPH|nr:hypothetical protein [Aureimonas flava]RIY00194.1 hypothetical protein D3218_12975 [Aureimonas flava]
MIVYGIDPGQNCGVCIYDTDRSLSAMEPMLLKAPKKAEDGRELEIEEKCWELGRLLVALMRQKRPHLVAIEEPMRAIPKKGNAAGSFSSNQIVGGIAMICGLKGIKLITIPSGTWRSHFYPEGFKPPVKVIQEKGGTTRTENDWKTAAREKCAELRITVTNHDMAEACGIAFAATFDQTFKWMQHNMEKAA